MERRFSATKAGFLVQIRDERRGLRGFAAEIGTPVASGTVFE
jgi:hypothetical protein